MSSLQQRWNTLTTATIPSAPHEVVHRWFNTITSHYSEPHRFYHTLTHIHDLLELYEIYQLNSPVICYAIWFHDIIYDPKRGDNEAQSAILFSEFATEVSLSDDISTTVQYFINCTKSHTEVPVGNKELDYFLDFDLSILAKSPNEYDKYAQQIRQEYIHYSDADYKNGRTRVLEKFIPNPSLYRTDEFKNKFLPIACSNMCRELEQLKHLP